MPLDLANRTLVPEPTCYAFTLAAPGPLVVRTRGECEVGTENTELSLTGPTIDTGLLVMSRDDKHAGERFMTALAMHRHPERESDPPVV